MKRKKYMEALGTTTYDAIRRLHTRYSSDGSTAGIMHTLFGEPTHCLICQEPLSWHGKRIPDDVDPWFCSMHCPVCLSVEHDQGEF